MSQEKTFWEGTPSHWTSFIYYLICIPLTFVFGLGLLMAGWRYLTIKKNIIKVTSQRIVEKKGVLSKTTNELELFRVKDIRLEEPFFLRLVGLSNIVLITSDRTDKIVSINGVKNGEDLKENLRSFIDKRRTEKGVKETDFE